MTYRAPWRKAMDDLEYQLVGLERRVKRIERWIRTRLKEEADERNRLVP